jgi:tape measure domain-containing protein
MADLRTRIIISSSDQTRQGFDSARQGIDNLRRQIDQVRNALIGVLGVSLGAGLVKQLVDTTDEFKNLQATIKLSTESEQEFNRASTELFNISQRTGTVLSGNADLYRRVSGAIREMGGDQERSLKLVELIGQAVTLGGKAAQTSAAGIEQFNQGLGSGVLRGQEFNSVMTNTPRLADALAAGFNATKGELRDMAEEGKLTAEAVVKALESQSDVLSKEFAKLPNTVGTALTRVGNAWTYFLGKLDEGKGASSSIADALNTVAENMEQLVNAGYALVKVLALVWAGKFVTGITQNTAAVVNNTIATWGANAAALTLLQTEVRRAEVALRSSVHLIKEAQAKRAAAVTDIERAAALRALNAAYAKHETNLAALATQQALLNQATRQGTLGMLLFGNAVGFVSRAFALLNRIFIAFLVIDIARTVFEWAMSFNAFRKVMYDVASGAEMLLTIFAYYASGRIFGGFWDELGQNLDRIAKKWDDNYQATTKSVDGTTQKVQQAAEEHKAAWQKVEESIKNLTTLSDEQFARQNADLKRHLDERLAAIDASEAQELEKDAQRAEALTQSAQAEIDLAKKTADEKLAILSLTYDKQIEKLAKSEERQKALEQASIEKRKAIYSQLAQHYAAVVDRLAQEHDREVQAARAAAEKLKDLALQHQFELNDISRAGADEYEKVQSETFEFERALADAKRELDKGKAGDQDKINSLLERAHELTRDLTSSEISLAESSDEISAARYSAARRLNDLYDEQKRALEQVKKAHEDNADILANKQQAALDKLEQVNGEIDKISDKLEREFEMQIHVDTTQVDAAIAKLDSIPTDKYVTIHTQTVSDGGGENVTVQGKQIGGEVQQFANGGFPRRQGRLPGFGGGDKIPSMLEGGEWIIRKEGVQNLEKSFGPGIMPLINEGQLPVFRASGGSSFGGNWKQWLGGGDWLNGGPDGGSFTFTILSFEEELQLRKQRLEKQLQLHANSFINWQARFAENLKKLEVSEQAIRDKLKSVKPAKISIPAPILPDLQKAPVQSGGRSDTVTLRFQAPSGKTATVQSNKSDVASVLQVLKEAGAVTV